MFNGEPIQLLRLRNPLGPAAEYVGSWSRDSPEWDDVPPAEQDRLQIRVDAGGDFWMSYADFVKTFTHLEVVHLDSDTSRDEPSLHHKATWQMRLYQGNWLRGVTAGGCRNNPGAYKNKLYLEKIMSCQGMIL